MKAFYNEIDDYCCAWLSNLMDAGLITPGKIENKSITELAPDDVKGYERVHFFAGIAGWDYALNLAGWGDEPVWTGSCPCQPFSVAGKQNGINDERHLAPAWLELIKSERPPVVFGEQVSNAIKHGWLDEICNELETENYSCGAAVLPACAVGAPHRRDRLWFVAADNFSQRRQRGRPQTIQRQSAFSWSQDVRGIEDLRKRSDLPEPLVRSLSDGVSRHWVDILHAFGNAIVPQVAAEFIAAYREVR